MTTPAKQGKVVSIASPQQVGQYQIVGQMEEAKNNIRGTEDGILVARVRNRSCFGLFDGVSTFSTGVLYEGMTAGQLAMNDGKRALAEALLYDYDFGQMVAHLSESLAHTVHKAKSVMGDAIGKPGYVFVAYFPERRKILRVGDPCYYINGEGHNPEMKCDIAKARARRIMLRRAIASGMTVAELLANDPTRPKMDELTNGWQQNFANSDDDEYGYGVINGTEVHSSLIEVIDVPPGARQIALTSDGIPEFVFAKDQATTHSELIALRMRDPLCYQEWLGVVGLLPKNEYVDDATGIWLEHRG